MGISKKVRKEVIDRASGCCEYCQILADYSPAPFDIEHIWPISKGGLSTLLNLALACGGCNGRKSDLIALIDRLSGKMTKFFNPRLEKWSEHFCWSKDGSLIIGLTDVGRVTVEALEMNRQELINLRKVLKIVRKHPPLHTV